MKTRLISLLLTLLLAACDLYPPQQSSLEPQANYWQQVGGVLDINTNQSAGGSSLALDNSGNPVAAWSESDGNIYVKRWTGSNWVQVGGILDTNTNLYAAAPSLALDNLGNPVVGWSESDGTTQNIYVKRWNGTSWIQLGGILDINNRNSYSPSLALDSNGNPVVSWQQPNAVSENIYVKRWNGSNWIQLGTFLDTNTKTATARRPSLAVDNLDNPVVSWDEFDGDSMNIHVKRWNGSSWVQVGGILDVDTDKPAYDPSLALDSSGNPVVSWTEGPLLGNLNIYVKRWNGIANTWDLVGTTFLDVNTNQRAGSSSLALDNSGHPVVSWSESDGSSANIYVKQYITNAWQNLGRELDTIREQSAINASVSTKSNNLPVVAWDEVDEGSNSKNVYVKFWNGTQWNIFGNALDRTLTNNAENPSLALRNDAPIVAFQEANDVYVRRWVSTAWVNVSDLPVDSNVANSAITPSLAVENTSNLPVVAYIENGNVLIKRANSVSGTASWLSPYGTLPLDKIAANTAYCPSLGLTSDNRPIVAWYEDDGTSMNVYVKEWNGTAWTSLGSRIDRVVTNDAKDVVLAVGSDNRPVVAWEEGGNIYAKRWTGTSWVALGGVLDKRSANIASRPSIDLKSDTNPVVAWQEQNGSSSDVYAKAWNGSSWVQISTTAADKVPSMNAQRPSLMLKSDNTPIISWDEHDGVSENVWVRQY